jgi:YD repeat-containing protein
LCPALASGYGSCVPRLGPASANGEDGGLGVDVNPATGNLFLSQLDAFAHPGLGPDLRFIRYYNSQANGVDIGLGPNWTHTYSWYVRVAGNSAMIVADTGRVIFFSSNGKQWIPENGEFGSLSQLGSSGYTYTDRLGTGYDFDALGRLTAIRAPDNYPLLIKYTSGSQIASVISQNCGASSGCEGMTLVFSYAGSHISAVTDPSGATWSYGYTTPIIPGLCVQAKLLGCPPQISQSGSVAGTLQSVQIPNAALPANAVHGTLLYAYTTQTIASATFSAATPGVTLTGYAVITNAGAYRGPMLPQTNVAESILGLFSYSNSDPRPMLIESAGGVVNAQLLRDMKLSYAEPIPKVQRVTTVTINGGQKKITSSYIDENNLRLAAISSTAGMGGVGEPSSEGWLWNGNLTLAAHIDGNATKTVFGPYDLNGNPTTITEAFNTPLQRQINITWHPRLSRPLSVTTDSVRAQGCLENGAINCAIHQIIFDYDAPRGGQFSAAWNSAPTNFVSQIVETGYTAGDLSGSLNATTTHVIQITRDSNNRIAQISAPGDGRSTVYDYYPATGYLWHTTRAVSDNRTLVSTVNAYDEDGRVTSETDPNGTTLNIVYDSAGNLASRSLASADGKSTSGYTLTRDLAEAVVQMSTPTEAISTEYDSGRRPWRVSAVPPWGLALSANATIWSKVIDYDTWDHPVTVRLFGPDLLGSDKGPGCAQSGQEQLCEEFGYDRFERLSSIHTLDWQDNACTGTTLNCTNSYEYDSNGYPWQSGNTVDGVATVTRNALNQVVSIRNRVAGVTTLGYDGNGNVVSRRDPRDPANGGSGGNRLARYVYDDFGHLILVQTPDIGTWTSLYDAAGNMVQSQDGSGARLSYQYDLLNRRTGVVAPTPTDSVTFSYDQPPATLSASGVTFANTLGRVVSIQAAGSSGHPVSEAFSYDYRGSVITDAAIRQGDLSPVPVKPVQYSRDASTGTLQSTVYPDGLTATLQYPTAGSSRSFAPSGVSVGFQGTSTTLVSGATYFADGVVQSLKYGNQSQMTLVRNKRGEVRSIQSGPVNSPVLWQAYTYSANDIGQVTSVTFFPNQANSWHWYLGYTRSGWLNSYSTDVRVSPFNPLADSYLWGYDEVGNRTGESFNGQQRTYLYDSGGATNQLRTATGQTALGVAAGVTSNVAGILNITYDSNGNTAAVDALVNNQGYELIFALAYNARHRLSTIVQESASVLFPTETFNTLPYQQLTYDGSDRVVEVLCPVPAPIQPGVVPSGGLVPAFGVCGAAVAGALSPNTFSGIVHPQPPGAPYAGATCSPWTAQTCDSNGDLLVCAKNGDTNTLQWSVDQTNSPFCLGSGYNPNGGMPSGSSGAPKNSGATWHEFYYGADGLLLEEIANNGATTSLGCPAYDVTDFVYLSKVEVARVIHQYQSVGGGADPAACSLDGYQLSDTDIQYLHHDRRGALSAVESRVQNGLAWEADVGPTGQVMSVGLPGADGKMGTGSVSPASILVSGGAAAGEVAGQLGGFLDLPNEIDPTTERSLQAGVNVWSAPGNSVYTSAVVADSGGIGSGDDVGVSVSGNLDESGDKLGDALGLSQKSSEFGGTFKLEFMGSTFLKGLELDSKAALARSVVPAPLERLIEFVEKLPLIEGAGVVLDKLSLIGTIHSLLTSNTTARYGKFGAAEYPTCMSTPCEAAWTSDTGMYKDYVPTFPPDTPPLPEREAGLSDGGTGPGNQSVEPPPNASTTQPETVTGDPSPNADAGFSFSFQPSASLGVQQFPAGFSFSTTTTSGSTGTTTIIGVNAEGVTTTTYTYPIPAGACGPDGTCAPALQPAQ